MRSLIIFLFFLVLSVWLGLQAERHPGYLLLVYHHKYQLLLEEV